MAEIGLFQMNDDLTLGRFAIIQDRLFPCANVSNDQYLVPSHESLDPTWETLHGPDGNFTWVPSIFVTRYFRRYLRARWSGVKVGASRLLPEDQVPIYPIHGQLDLAELGFEGNHYDGWSKIVPISELEHVEIHEREYPVDDMR